MQKTKGQKTKTGAVKKNCRGHSQSNQECGAGQQVTPFADLKFVVERSQNHIEAAAAGTEHPFCRKAAESDPQEQPMLQEGRQSRLACHPEMKLLLLLVLLLCEGYAV